MAAAITAAAIISSFCKHKTNSKPWISDLTFLRLTSTIPMLQEYGGRTLRVNFSDKPKPKEPLYPETKYKLFVGNLSWSVTSKSLTELFSEHGNVVEARVLYDGETGRSRGYGFVSYSMISEMETALQILNGVELEGRSLRVSLSQGKKQ